MSAFVKLGSAMPGDPETNGVDALAATLIDNPDVIRYAVIWFDVSKITDLVDSHELIPTIRVRRIEPLGTADQVDPAIANAVAAAVEKRTGRKAIPFALVEVEGYDPDQLSLVPETT
jgi:hypothetical protein